MTKYNDVLIRPYKNTEIEVVVEDDVITTTKVFLDGKCLVCNDITTDTGEDVPYNKANLEKVLDMAREYVDAVWEENVTHITR